MRKIERIDLTDEEQKQWYEENRAVYYGSCLKIETETQNEERQTALFIENIKGPMRVKTRRGATTNY